MISIVYKALCMCVFVCTKKSVGRYTKMLVIFFLRKIGLLVTFLFYILHYSLFSQFLISMCYFYNMKKMLLKH